MFSVAPSKDLYYYFGTAFWSRDGKTEQKIELDLNQFLHRGSILRNSGKVYGLVIATGSDTKQIKNFGAYKLKVARFERFWNIIQFGNLLFMLSLSCMLTGLNIWWNRKYSDEYPYIFYNIEWNGVAVKAFFSFWIMTNSVMALNVEVVFQMSKLVYTIFVEYDQQMTYPDYQLKDVKHTKVRNLNMIEELAQIEYLFCDKTGTLTQNELVFKQVSIFDKQTKIANGNLETVAESIRAASNQEPSNMFFLCANLCHECIVVESKKEKATFNYTGPSTDEVCLLDMARTVKEFGYYNDRDSETLLLMHGNTE